MAVSRRTKIILTVVAIPVVLFLLSLLALKFYFTSERLKALILPRIQSAINREITVKDINLSIFPTLGVSIDELAVANRKGKGFSERPMVLVQKFLLAVKVRSLVANRVEIDHLVFDKPSIFLEINEDGEENFSNSEAKDSKERKSEKGFSVKYRARSALLLSNLEVKNGDFEYTDQKANKTIRMKGTDVRLRMETIPQANELRVQNEVDVSGLSYGGLEKPFIQNFPVHLRQKATIRAEENQLTIEKGEVQIQDIRFGVNGSVTAVDGVPFLDLTIGSENIEFKEILSLLPRGVLKGVDNAEMEGNARLSGSIKGKIIDNDQPEISFAVLLTNGKIQYTNLPKAITDINFKASFVNKGSSSTLDIADFSAKLGDNPVQMRMTIRELSDPVVDVQLDGIVNLSDVKDFYPLEAGKELSGIARAKVSVKGEYSAPTSLRGNGTVELREVSIGSAETPIHHLNSVVTFNNQLIETKRLTMNYGRSDLSISFEMRNYLSAILPSVFGAGKGTATKPSMTLSLVSPYFESTPSSEPIVFPPFDVDAALKISKFVYKGKEPLECTDVRGSVTAVENVIRVKNLSFQTLSGKMNATGTIDLRNPKRPQFALNVQVEGVDGHSLMNRFSSFGKNLFAKLSFGLALNGELDDTLGIIHKSLSGSGNVRMADGKLVGYPVMERLSSFLDLPDLKEVSFKSWSNTFKISDGKINIPDLKIGTAGHDLLLTGRHGFNGSLDYSLTIKLSEALSNQFLRGGVVGQVADLFRDKGGRLTLFLLVGGTTDTPTLRWDTKAAQQRLRERVVEGIEKKKEEAGEKTKEGLQKKIDEGKKKVEEQLKKLFKKP